jgi:hypothetical protein
MRDRSVPTLENASVPTSIELVIWIILLILQCELGQGVGLTIVWLGLPSMVQVFVVGSFEYGVSELSGLLSGMISTRDEEI